MKRKLIDLILEAAGNGLTVFDIDETLFHTKAKVRVKKGRKVVKVLNNIEYIPFLVKIMILVNLKIPRSLIPLQLLWLK